MSIYTTFQGFSLKARTTRLLTLIGSVLTILTIAAFFDETHPNLQMLTQLRVQFALGLLLIMLPLLFLKWQIALIFGVALVVNVAHFAPLYVRPADHRHVGNSLSIVHVNVDRDKVDILDRLNVSGGDIVFIQEVQPTVSAEFAARMTNYIPLLVEARWDTRGSALLVRRGLAGVISADYLTITTYGDRPLAHAVIDLNGHKLSLLSLHVTRPENPLQAIEFADVAAWSQAEQALGREVFIIGDFNQTPWSSRFQTLLSAGNLINGQRGFGLQTTWPASLPAFLRIPIDHTVHSGGVIVVERAVGAGFGGDHRPIHVTIATIEPDPL